MQLLRTIERAHIRINLGAIALAASAMLGCADSAWCTTGEPSNLSDAEIAILQSPAFKKRFIESYIAESDIEPKVVADEREKLEKILAQISSNKLDEAVRALEKHRSPSSSAVMDFTLANIHFQQDRLEQAATLYETCIAKHPKFRRAWRNLALIHVRQRDFERAVPALTRVIELGGGDGIMYGLLGYGYLTLENNIAAESAYRMANLLDGQTVDWKIGLARALFKQERFADAAAITGQLLTEDPSRGELWLLQANAYLGLNQPERAAENYQVVERMGQSTADSLNMLGDIYVNGEQYDLAASCYIKALEQFDALTPDRAIRAAKVMAARGAASETSVLLSRIEELRHDIGDTDRKDLLKIKTRIAVETGSESEENRLLEEIVALDPLDGEALILLGQRYARNGELEKAAFYYERAASIEKYEADAKVRHAQLLVRQSKYADALSLLRRAQSIQPREHVQQYMMDVERVARTK